MEDHQPTIGLGKLLDEIATDLDELRKKHPSDYNIKSITMWWELEKERVLARHHPGLQLRKLRRAQSLQRMMLLFFAGCATMIAVQLAMRIVLE